MKFEEFVKTVDDTFMSHQASRSSGKISAANQWRYGQTVMNVLWDIWPNKYNEIKNSNLNCFYTNRTVALVLNKLEKEWHEKVS